MSQRVLGGANRPEHLSWTELRTIQGTGGKGRHVGGVKAQERIGGLFQRQGGGQGGLPVCARIAIDPLPLKQGGVVAVQGFGEGYIA